MLVRVVAWLGRPLGSHTHVDREAARDAIVVLGAPLAADGRLSAIAGERVRAAVRLYRDGRAPLVVLTGGVTAGQSRAESDVMAEALRALDVHALVAERRSQTTRENAAFTVPLLPRGARVWLVTQPFHERRAERAFRRAGFDAVAWPIADSLQHEQPRRAAKWIAREYAAWARELLRRA